MYQHDFILVDQSGSMQGRWVEALSSINVYVRKLAEQKLNTGVTVVFFDSNMNGRLNFRTVRDRITPESFKPLSNDDGRPNGGTPLSDATVKIVSLAEQGNYDKVSFIIMTDGEENSSTMFSVAEAKSALARCTAKDWAVTFMGADFQNDNQAQSYGIALNSAVTTATGNYGSTLENLGTKRGFYASAAVGQAAGSMTFTAQEKTDASTQGVGIATGGNATTTAGGASTEAKKVRSGTA